MAIETKGCLWSTCYISPKLFTLLELSEIQSTVQRTLQCFWKSDSAVRSDQSCRVYIKKKLKIFLKKEPASSSGSGNLLIRFDLCLFSHTVLTELLIPLKRCFIWHERDMVEERARCVCLKSLSAHTWKDKHICCIQPCLSTLKC